LLLFLLHVNMHLLGLCLNCLRFPWHRSQRLVETEKEYTVELDRTAAEAALTGKPDGAFLIRPKDFDSIVVSILQRGGQVVDHPVIHRVNEAYQLDGTTFGTIHELLASLQSARGLPVLTFFERCAARTLEPVSIISEKAPGSIKVLMPHHPSREKLTNTRLIIRPEFSLMPSLSLSLSFVGSTHAQNVWKF
jgi:hypothetical protein